MRECAQQQWVRRGRDAQQGGRAQVAPQGETDAGTSTPESKREGILERISEERDCSFCAGLLEGAPR